MHMAIFQKIERTNVSHSGVGLLQDDFYNENRPVIPALVSAGQLSFLLYPYAMKNVSGERNAC